MQIINTENLPLTVTLKDASEITGISYHELRKLYLSGVLHGIRCGTLIRLNSAELLQYCGVGGN